MISTIHLDSVRHSYWIHFALCTITTHSHTRTHMDTSLIKISSPHPSTRIVHCRAAWETLNTLLRRTHTGRDRRARHQTTPHHSTHDDTTNAALSLSARTPSLAYCFRKTRSVCACWCARAKTTTSANHLAWFMLSTILISRFVDRARAAHTAHAWTTTAATAASVPMLYMYVWMCVWP